MPGQVYCCCCCWDAAGKAATSSQLQQQDRQCQAAIHHQFSLGWSSSLSLSLFLISKYSLSLNGYHHKNVRVCVRLSSSRQHSTIRRVESAIPKRATSHLWWWWCLCHETGRGSPPLTTLSHMLICKQSASSTLSLSLQSYKDHNSELN